MPKTTAMQREKKVICGLVEDDIGIYDLRFMNYRSIQNYQIIQIILSMRPLNS